MPEFKLFKIYQSFDIRLHVPGSFDEKNDFMNIFIRKDPRVFEYEQKFLKFNEYISYLGGLL